MGLCTSDSNAVHQRPNHNVAILPPRSLEDLAFTSEGYKALLKFLQDDSKDLVFWAHIADLERAFFNPSDGIRRVRPRLYFKNIDGYREYWRDSHIPVPTHRYFVALLHEFESVHKAMVVLGSPFQINISNERRQSIASSLRSVQELKQPSARSFGGRRLALQEEKEGTPKGTLQVRLEETLYQLREAANEAFAVIKDNQSKHFFASNQYKRIQVSYLQNSSNSQRGNRRDASWTKINAKSSANPSFHLRTGESHLTPSDCMWQGEFEPLHEKLQPLVAFVPQSTEDDESLEIGEFDRYISRASYLREIRVSSQMSSHMGRSESPPTPSSPRLPASPRACSPELIRVVVATKAEERDAHAVLSRLQLLEALA